MVGELDLFNSVQYLEPKCPNCQNKINYGVTTRYIARHKAHVCKKCGFVLK